MPFGFLIRPGHCLRFYEIGLANQGMLILVTLNRKTGPGEGIVLLRFTMISAMLVLIVPVAVLCGMPGLTPAWMNGDLAGVPVINLVMLVWFAAFAGLAWVPVKGGTHP